jgi:hypothetical protein
VAGRGYLAATRAEIAASAAVEAPVDPAVRMRDSALAVLGTTTPLDRPLTLAAGFDWTAGPADTPWVVAELGQSAARLSNVKG